jgi:hypothetical protein
MKRVELSAIGLGLLTSVGLLTVERAYAGENDHAGKCTLETLNGQYLVAANGTLIPPVPYFQYLRDRRWLLLLPDIRFITGTAPGRTMSHSRSVGSTRT